MTTTDIGKAYYNSSKPSRLPTILWGRMASGAAVGNRRATRLPVGSRVAFGQPAPHPVGHTRGSALLAVLWLSAALAAIAFSLSTTVRGETERASTSVDGMRAYYLAVSAVDRAS